MALSFRRRCSADDAFIQALASEAFQEYTTDSRARALPMTRDANAITIVATDEDVQVGFAVLRIKSSANAYLDAIAVSTRARGRGVGSSLLRRAESEAKTQRARALDLVTAEANLAALELFLKHGFRIIRSMPRFYPRGQNAHLLRKDLGDGGSAP
jgi:[ribosomal protein S18]-alanine N-acetyltransferase